MAEHIEHMTARTAAVPAASQVVQEDRVVTVRRTNRAARIIWFIAGVLLVLLGLRFVFALLGANPANGVANFVYTVSHPFVAPFFSLFGYNLHYGVSRFETYTLVAMVIYALVAWGLARLTDLARPTAYD